MMIKDCIDRIEEDVELERLFARELLDKVEWIREGTHRGDVTGCPLSFLYGKMGLKPQLDIQVEMVMAIGRAHHVVLEVLEDHAKEYEAVWKEIINTIDLYKDHPLEIKTSRMSVGDQEKLLEMDIWLEQLCSASIATGKSMARIFTLNIISGIPTAWRVYFREGGLKNFAMELLRRRDLNQKAYHERDPLILLPESPRYEWQCTRRVKHRMIHCRWKHICIKHHPYTTVQNLLRNKYDEKFVDAMKWIQSGEDRVSNLSWEYAPITLTAWVRGDHETYTSYIDGTGAHMCSCLGEKRYKVVCKHILYLTLWAWFKGKINLREMKFLLF